MKGAMVLVAIIAATLLSANAEAQSLRQRLNQAAGKVSGSSSDSGSSKGNKSSKAAKGGKGLVSATPIFHGQTEGLTSASTLNAGDEIWAYIPLKEPLTQDVTVCMNIDGDQPYQRDYVAYETEEALTYLKFGLACNPESYFPDARVRKEGLYPAFLNVLAELSPGEHKVSFGVCEGLGIFQAKANFTLTVTAEGKATWARWARELAEMQELHQAKINKY